MPDWRRKGQETVKDRKEGSSVKLDDGVTCFRVMPDKADLLPDGRYAPKDGGHPPYREYRLHRHWGPDDATVTCGKDIDGKGRCWGCDDVIPKLLKDPRKAIQVTGKDNIGPQEQFVIQASKFDVNTQKFKLPKIMYLSTGAGVPGRPGTNTIALRVYSKLVGTQKDYIDPVKGYNLNVEKTGAGLKTRYLSVEGDESPTKVPLAVLMAVQSLDSLLPKYDEEDMKSLWFGRPRRDRDDRGGSSGGDNADDGIVDDDGVQDAEFVDDGATDLADPDTDIVDDADGEFADDPPADDEFAADELPADDEYAADDALDPDPDQPVDDDPPEEYGDVEDEAPPPPTRRPAPTQGRQPARTAAPPQRAPARQPAPAPAPARRPAAAPAPTQRRPAPPASPARPAATKRAAPATAKRPAPRR